jgi:hypothetical protein
MARFNLYGSDSVNRESVFIFYLVGPTVIDPMVGACHHKQWQRIKIPGVSTPTPTPTLLIGRLKLCVNNQKIDS